MRKTHFIELDRKYLDDVIALEPQIYTHGWSANLIMAEFDKSISRRYGIIRDRHLVGYSFNYIVEDEFHILNLGIDPTYRGVGLGGGLLDFIIKMALNENCKQCLLEVRRSNLLAQKLYLSRGFKVNGLRLRYYSDNQEDAVLMEARLN